MQEQFEVYFDGSCPLCRKEIGFYKSRTGADAIRWVDVSRGERLPEGLSCSDAMARFHVRDTDGRLIKGGEAFAALWAQLPSFRWLGLAFRRAPLRWLLNLGYKAFLPLRPRLQRLFASRNAA
ncbi:MAG: DUF393 domain-containing protein [Henriciella sp.]|uniref:thiol-disulfide oxidoreductase DCC family protein n=1 Tax=Henriciella sp. TaxID=1968823 RepID=UPI003C78839F